MSWCAEYGAKYVPGSNKPVSKSDDLCPGEGDDDKRGAAVCNGKVDGGEGQLFIYVFPISITNLGAILCYSKIGKR